MDYYYCSECKYRTEDRANYEKHIKTDRHKKKMNNIPTTKTYICDIEGCFYKTKVYANFNVHQKNHLKGIIRFRCKVCDVFLKDKHHLNRHFKQIDHITKVLEKELNINKTKDYVEILTI